MPGMLNDVVDSNDILRLVINLDRSPKRFESIAKQLSSQGLSFLRMSGKDGSKLTAEELSHLREFL